MKILSWNVWGLGNWYKNALIKRDPGSIKVNWVAW